MRLHPIETTNHNYIYIMLLRQKLNLKIIKVNADSRAFA